MALTNLDPANLREFRRLMISVKASTQRLNLLLAICDDRSLQDTLVAAYESELIAQEVMPFRAWLNLKQPSLRATLKNLVAQEPVLQTGEPAVVTVLNASELLGVRLTDDKSEQERFFFSLQWTRGALIQFEFPVVLWLSNALSDRLAQQAPDFWSWRGGMFEFATQPQNRSEHRPRSRPMREVETPDRFRHFSIEAQQRQIAQLEQTAPESPLLVTLYNHLGKAHEQKHAYEQAMEFYERALALAKLNHNSTGQARSLSNMGDSLHRCGKSVQALDFYEQALTLYREDKDGWGEELVFGKLGLVYYSLEHYQQAIDLLQQQVEISREMGDRADEAILLGNLGLAYHSLGQYQQAIELLQQSLEISREIGDRSGEAFALGNLGNVYAALGQSHQAGELHQQELKISREIG
ncbi:tetratricopeptide repeat protein [Romeria aff. gracilis LEGE 07310]|uniref:Tetratricopeptide repeat protein n=1 Tax=Vasconcelosia minhoensis LEGE 07310 TaxID=915328 RepID=A0A8J7APR1_9CYAN|nr:tetratricopeptide repeat protein [Romeria gracilis]MBE9078016.1 tetratricopeptide repeat protein [Romeria aff. gracilis LEGE 07310]